MTVMIDTGVFFAYYSMRDAHHMDAVALLIHMAEGVWGRAYITNHILDETLNILKYRVSPVTAVAFLEAFLGTGIVSVLHLNPETEEKALKLFRRHADRKGLSYTDATTIATFQEYGLDVLLSFDKRSFNGLLENIVGPDYWDTLPPAEKKRITRLTKNGTRKKRDTHPKNIEQQEKPPGSPASMDTL